MSLKMLLLATMKRYSASVKTSNTYFCFGRFTNHFEDEGDILLTFHT